MSEEQTPPCRCEDPILSFCYLHKRWSKEAREEAARARLARSTVDTVPGGPQGRTRSSQKMRKVVEGEIDPDKTSEECADTDPAPNGPITWPGADPDASWPSDDT